MCPLLGQPDLFWKTTTSGPPGSFRLFSAAILHSDLIIYPTPILNFEGHLISPKLRGSTYRESSAILYVQQNKELEMQLQGSTQIVFIEYV